MSIRQALRKHAATAAQRQGKPPRPAAMERWCGSNAILVIMAAILAVACIVEIVRG